MTLPVESVASVVYWTVERLKREVDGGAVFRDLVNNCLIQYFFLSVRV